MADQLPIATQDTPPPTTAPAATPVPAVATPPTPAATTDPTNSIVGPYVPSHIQTGLNNSLPVTIQMDTDARLNRIFNPSLTVNTSTTEFGDFFDTRKQQNLPNVSLKDAYFSQDPKVRNLAASMLQGGKDQFAQTGAGNQINTPYDQASKYLGKEFGFTALSDNEDVYAQYKNPGFSGVVENVGKFVARTVGSAVLKLGEGVSGLLAMPLAAVEDGHFWTNVSDNALVQAFDNGEKGFKDNWFPVYQAAAERGDGFFGRMFNDSTFWTSDFSDGLAFMLSAFLPGTALSKVGLAAKLGETAEILNYSKLGKLGSALKFATGEAALTAQGVDALATTTLNTASEAFFEAKGVHDSVVQKYTDMLSQNPDQQVTLPDGSKKSVRNLSKDDIESIAAHGARNDFMANFPILMFSEAFETNLMYKALGKSPVKLKGLSIAEDLTAEVEKPTSKIGKLIHGRLGFYTEKSVEAAWWEGLWEENAQLAAQRLNDDSTEYDHNDPALVSFAKQLYKQTKDAFAGKDAEAASSIGMGILMGVGAGNITSALGKEYSREKQEAILTAARLNNLRDRFLTGDIYQKDAQGNYAQGPDGKMVVDQDKLNAAAIRTNQFADKAKRQESFKNADLRNLESQISFSDYFRAAILAGKDGDVLSRLNSLQNKSPQQLAQIGFDPEQVKGNPQAFMNLGKQLQDIHEDVEGSDLGSRPKEISSRNFAEINLARKSEIYNRRAMATVYGNMAQVKSTQLDESLAKMQNQSNSSLSDAAVHEYNTLKYRQDLNQQLIEDTKDPNTVNSLKEVNKNIDEHLRELSADMKDSNDKPLQKDPEGYYYFENPDLDKRTRSSGYQSLMDQTASLHNMSDLHDVEANKVADPKDGFKYFTGKMESQTKNILASTSPSLATQSNPTTGGTVSNAQNTTSNISQSGQVVQTSPQVPPSANTTIQQSINASQPQSVPVAVAASQNTAPSGSPISNAAGLPIHFYGKDGDAYTTYDPDANETGTYKTPEEAREAVNKANVELEAARTKDLGDGKSPISQEPEEAEQDNKENLQTIQQQAGETNTEFGKMIVNSLSVASKAVEFDSETGIGPRDENGRPKFNYEQDSIIDFGIVVPGSPIELSVDLAADTGFIAGQNTEGNNDLLQIKITGFGGKKLGYLHTLQGARRLLTQNADVDGELKKLSDLRNQFIADPSLVLKAEVTKTGFGFANKADNRGYKTIDEATEKDRNAILAVKKGNSFVGEGGTVQNTRFGTGIKEGATVLMLPNVMDGVKSLIPVYVAKKSVSTDPKIKDIVQAGIMSYLNTGDSKELNAARDYIYITSSSATAISLTNNGLFLNKNGELIFRGKNISSMAMGDLMNQLLVNINDKKLNDPKYVSLWRNSPSIQTTFFARTRPGTQDKSYFHQHTIQFSNPTNTNNGQSNQSGSQSRTQVNQVGTGQAQQQTGNASLQKGRNGQEGQVSSNQQGKTSPADVIRQESITLVEKKRKEELDKLEGRLPIDRTLPIYSKSGAAGDNGKFSLLGQQFTEGLHVIVNTAHSTPDGYLTGDHMEIIKTIKPQVMKDGKMIEPAVVDTMRFKDANEGFRYIANMQGKITETYREKVKAINDKYDKELKSIGVATKGMPPENDIEHRRQEELKGLNREKYQGMLDKYYELTKGDGTQTTESQVEAFGKEVRNDPRLLSMANKEDLVSKLPNVSDDYWLGMGSLTGGHDIRRSLEAMGTQSYQVDKINKKYDAELKALGIDPNGETLTQSSQENEQEKIDRLNQELAADMEQDGFILDDISPVHDLSEAMIEKVAAQPSSLLLSGFNAFIQEDAINSVSQLLLSNNGEGDVADLLFKGTDSNKDTTKAAIDKELAKYNDRLAKYQPLIAQGNPQALRIQTMTRNLQLLSDNFDAIHKMAVERLNKVGLVSDEQGYYSAAENDDDFLRYDDDSEYTRDNYSSISKLVKQFISFNSEKIEKDGKVGNRVNSLGLPTVVQSAEVYSKIINWLSESYFAPTYEGFLSMVDNLSQIPDPTIQDIAKRLGGSQNAQLKFQFFTNMLKFKTNHIQQLVTINREGVFARNIEANLNQMAKVTFSQLSDEFLQNSRVLAITTDEYGNTVQRVDKEQVQPYLNDFVTISRDRNSYGTRRDQNGQPTGIKYLKEEAANKLYLILQNLGFNFSQKAFLRAISSQSSSNPRGDAQTGIQNLFTGGNKILRNMAEGEGESQERDLRNPFISNPTEMNTLARIEANYRKITQTDAFRSNGKSYYPFTRLSFVKSIFQQVTQYAKTGQITPLLKTFAWDPFKSASRFLARAQQDASFAPELEFARGTKETGSKGTNQEIKDQNGKDFVVSKIHAFQNSGNKEGLFFSDTYSDKTTRFQIKAAKEEIAITFDQNGKAKVDNATIDKFYNYFQGELRRVNQVREHNESLAADLRIAGFHDSVNGKEGIGKYFVIFNYLNEETLPEDTAALIYNTDGSVKTDSAAIAAIKGVINDNLVKLTERYQAKLERYGMFSDEKGGYSVKGINDNNYYRNIAGKFDEYWDEKQQAFYMTADYVLNSALNSLEMLTLTGDPAQSPKVKTRGSGEIRLGQSIRATLTEVSKRNASLNAPFDQGIAIRAEYNVGFLQDLKINSDQLDEYKKLLPSQAEAVEAGYKNGDMTDAQEVTTVKEHLTNLLSMGRISPVEFVEGLAHFDPEDFEESKKDLAAILKQLGITHTLNLDTIRQETARKDMTGLLQVFKPVQRYSRWDANLGMVVETYIKTSSFPLVPALVKGKDFEEILRQMKVNKVDRLDFSSGVKQGLINPQPIYSPDGSVNGNLFTTNKITLPADAWGEQVENPEKEALKVTEGSQQQRMIFVDLGDDQQLNYKGQPITGKELRKQYVDNHRTIFHSKLNDLFDELGVESADGINNFASLGKLSDILQREGLDRDYDRNTLLSLGLNKAGQFEVPLTFLPNASEIQALVAAVISNRVLKNKLPGTSLIQGSEMVIKTNGKVKVSGDIRQAPKGSIVWTKPEYANISKLQYIRTKNGEVKPAQIVLPFYFKTKEGKSVKVSDYTNAQGFLDTSRIDPELLEINGFRIPYAGPNSGMWFEVVGYLPETMGSLVIVPAEVAAQMGADYDVDKLFTYVLNHTVGAKGIRIDRSTPQKAAENDIIEAHKSIYLNADRLSKTIEPTSTDELADAVERNLPKPSQEVTQIFDPEHQDNVWLSNRAGQLGVGISANFNTFHSLAQQANLFVKAAALRFADKSGEVYNETTNSDSPRNRINEHSNNLEENHNDDLYTFDDGDGPQNALTDYGITRLDRINTFPNPYTGQTRSISSVINNWLQASVDNAKLQLLGLGGINKFNFNVALTIALHGFDSDWVLPFINQPILKEYYDSISGLNDKFNKDFSADRKGGAISDLFKKYVDKLQTDKYSYDVLLPITHEQLIQGVNKEFEGMDKEDIALQLEVLKQFLQLEKVGATISGISGDTKVEVNGLSKSFAEINQQAKDIETLGNSAIGNVNRLRTDTVSGVYLDVPGMIDDLFNHPDNPLFAYSTPVYQYISSAIQGLTGKNLGAEDLDDVYKDFKQFVYTHPSLGLHSEANSINSIKNSYLSNRELVNSWQEMKAKYPSSILLNQLSSQTQRRESDPGILTMQSAADDIATQIKQEWLDFFKSEDPALVTFVNQLTTYSLLFGSKEYGPSNMLKYIPFEVLKGIGFGDRLNELNQQLSKPELFVNFLRQYMQHNQEQAKFLSNKALPKETYYQKIDDKIVPIPVQFTLPEPTLQNLDKYAAYKAIAVPGPDSSFGYRKYIRTYINDTIGHALYELQQDNRTYRRIDTLGNQYINEYDFANPNVRTIFPLKQAVQDSEQVDTAPPAPTQNPNPTADDITATYAQAKTVGDVLDTIQLRAGSSTDPVGLLHYELAKALVGKSNYTVEFTNNGQTRGTTYHNNSHVQIHTNEIERVANKLGISYEQALQQTILHEAVHTTVDKYLKDQSVLPSGQQSPQYKEITNVWNEYRKDLVTSGSSTFVRGIQDSFLEAELFKTLYERFVGNRTGSNYEADLKTIFGNWDNIKQNGQELLSVVHDMQESMKQAHNDHGISKGANFDLVKKVGGLFQSVDTERVAQIVDYLDKNFSKDSPANLKEKYYAYVSPFEFNTMTMTSPGFMQHLNSVQSSKVNDKSLWEKFKDVIRKIVSSFNNNSLLPRAIDAVMDITHALTEKQVEQTSAEKDKSEDELPPWEVNDATKKAIAQTIPTTETTRSFTFADGITIPTPAFSLNQQQGEALQKMANHVEAVRTGKQKDRLFTLSGFAGTGKSSTAKFLVQYLNKRWGGQITFKLSSPTHKANKVLGRFFRGTINEVPVTTKSLLGYKAERDPITNKNTFVLDESKNRIPRNGVLIVDEASFIGQREFQDIVDAAAQKGAVVIFMGDIAQIPSPDGSNRVSPAFGLPNQYQLTKVERQQTGNPLARIYDHIRNNLLIDGFRNLFPHNTDVNSKGEGIQFISGDYRDTAKLLKEALKSFQSDEFKTNKMAAKIIAYGNPTVEAYNRQVRESILQDASQDFQIGELLMGYEQKAQIPVVQNGQDYVITDRKYNDAKRIDKYEVSGFDLRLKEADEIEPTKGIANAFILNPKDIRNQPFVQYYVDLLEQLKNAKGRDYFEAIEKIGRLEENALVPETIYSYQNRAYTNSMLREQFPALFKFDEQTNQRPIDKMTSIAKNIDYGYAVTAHKVQGSTYSNVFIDENNLEFDKRMIQGPTGANFSYERNNLLYVALSRPTTKATVLSKNTVSESNTHNTGVQELAQDRSISEKLNTPTEVPAAGPVLNVSDTTVDKIRKGTKTAMNTPNPIREGIYYLKDGTKIQVTYQGEVAAVQSSREVFITTNPDDLSNATRIPFDEYAKKEGYANWKDFQGNAKSSQDFINGDEVRYSYSIKSIGKNYDISDVIDNLKKDNQLKQNCI